MSWRRSWTQRVLWYRPMAELHVRGQKNVESPGVAAPGVSRIAQITGYPTTLIERFSMREGTKMKVGLAAIIQRINLKKN